MLTKFHGLLLAACLGGLAAFTPSVAAAEGTLVLYCGVDEGWCRAMATTFEKETGIHTDMTRQSAGELYARLRAEKENPRGDIWGRHR
jgi:iron(III) transport system substrate-binding protein